MKKIYLIDSSIYIFHAWFGGDPASTNLAGEPNQAFVEKFGRELCSRVAALSIPHENSEVGDSVTISAGAVLFHPDGRVTSKAALALVDEALYEAKGRGRNQVVVGGPVVPAAQTAASGRRRA